jgi:hypothetical protein
MPRARRRKEYVLCPHVLDNAFCADRSCVFAHEPERFADALGDSLDLTKCKRVPAADDTASAATRTPPRDPTIRPWWAPPPPPQSTWVRLDFSTRHKAKTWSSC